MTIELDFEISGVLDYDADLIKCISTNEKTKQNYVGFKITGDKFRFYNSRLNGSPDEATGKATSLTSLNLVEGKRTRISFVIEPSNSIKFPMCYSYINGILSSAVMYEDDDGFKDADNPAYFTINSKQANIKIYGIRVYSTALSDKVILNIYDSELRKIEEGAVTVEAIVVEQIQLGTQRI